jgi:hypothetical protein
MKKIKATQLQLNALQTLSRKDLRAIRKHPRIVSAAKQLAKACERIITLVGAIPRHANARKRQTAYKRIVNTCRTALKKFEGD